MSDDYGDLVHGVFLDPERYNDKLVQGASHSATAVQLVESFQQGEFRFRQFTYSDDILIRYSYWEEGPLCAG